MSIKNTRINHGEHGVATVAGRTPDGKWIAAPDDADDELLVVIDMKEAEKLPTPDEVVAAAKDAIASAKYDYKSARQNWAGVVWVAIRDAFGQIVQQYKVKVNALKDAKSTKKTSVFLAKAKRTYELKTYNAGRRF